MLRAIRLSAAKGDRDAALAEFATLCADPKIEDGLLSQAADVLLNRKWSHGLDQALLAALPKPSRSPAVPTILIRRFVRTKRMRKARRVIRGLKPNPAEYSRATHNYILEIGSRREAREVRVYLTTQRRRLRADDDLWGISGYALHTIRHYRAVIRWMRDWRDRRGAQAWMLVNLAEALRAVGRDRAGHEVNVHAFKLAVHAKPHGIHSLWLAADAALAGDTARAAQYLAEVDMAAQEKSYHFMRGMIDALVTGIDQGPTAFLKCRQQIEAAERQFPAFRKEIEQRRFYRKCLWKLSRLGPGLGGRLWCWRRLAA